MDELEFPCDEGVKCRKLLDDFEPVLDQIANLFLLVIQELAFESLDRVDLNIQDEVQAALAAEGEIDEETIAIINQKDVIYNTSPFSIFELRKMTRDGTIDDKKAVELMFPRLFIGDPEAEEYANYLITGVPTQARPAPLLKGYDRRRPNVQPDQFDGGTYLPSYVFK